MHDLKIKHIAALDSLRAIAALTVFAQHFTQQYHPLLEHEWFGRLMDTLGQFGVGAFFVLSGFLIHSGGLAEKNNKGFISWKSYFWRRSSRILPGYYISLLACALLVQFWQSDLMLPTGGPGLLAHFFLISSFIPGEYSTINAVFWTVVVECHFYAIYVLMWKTTADSNLVRVGLIFIAGSLLTFLLATVLTSPGPFRSLLQITAPPLLWKWCMGVLIAEACYSNRLPWLSRFFSNEWLLIPTIAIILGGCLLTNPSLAVNYKRFIVPIGCFGLVCLCVFSRLNKWRSRFLEWSGSISYSIYLWHPISLLTVLHLTQLTGAAAFATALTMTYGLSWISYILIEKPGIAYGRKRAASLA